MRTMVLVDLQNWVILDVWANVGVHIQAPWVALMGKQTLETSPMEIPWELSSPGADFASSESEL